MNRSQLMRANKYAKFVKMYKIFCIKKEYPTMSEYTRVKNSIISQEPADCKKDYSIYHMKYRTCVDYKVEEWRKIEEILQKMRDEGETIYL